MAGRRVDGSSKVSSSPYTWPQPPAVALSGVTLRDNPTRSERCACVATPACALHADRSASGSAVPWARMSVSGTSRPVVVPATPLEGAVDVHRKLFRGVDACLSKEIWTMVTGTPLRSNSMILVYLGICGWARSEGMPVSRHRSRNTWKDHILDRPNILPRNSGNSARTRPISPTSISGTGTVRFGSTRLFSVGRTSSALRKSTSLILSRERTSLILAPVYRRLRKVIQ